MPEEVKPTETKVEPVVKAVTDLPGDEIKVTFDDNDPTTVDDFIKAGSKAFEELHKEPVTEEKKEEVKPAEKVEKPVGDDALKKASEAKVIEGEKKVPEDGRDYTGIDESDIPLFRKTGNESFKKLKDTYIKAKTFENELKTTKENFEKLQKEHKEFVEKGPKIPENYWDHPEGYLLTPEFAPALNEVRQAELIKNHWDTQFKKISEGAKEFEMIRQDQRTGQLYTEKVPADMGSENALMRLQIQADNYLSQTQGNLQRIVQGHSQKHQEQASMAKKIENDFFNSLTDSEEKKKIYEPMIKDTADKLPNISYNKNVMAKAIVLITTLGNMLKMAAEEKKKTQDNISRTVQPKAGELLGGGDGRENGKANDNVTFDDFEAVKNSR